MLLLCLLFYPFSCCQTYHTQLSDCYTKKLPIFFSPAISNWLWLVLKPIRIVLRVNRFQNIEYQVYSFG